MTAGDLIFNGAGKATTTEARRALYEDALAIIRREFAADLRLADVARRIGASSRALQRAFAEHGELSFSEELRATRLNVAARLLRGTDLPVGAVARRVGYGDHAPFTKAFRRHHAMSPRAYAARGRSFGGNGQGTAVSALRIQDKSLSTSDQWSDPSRSFAAGGRGGRGMGGAAGRGGGGAAPPAALD